jgi:hypothetical protein
MNQTKLKFGLSMMQQFTPLRFDLLEYYYISKENNHLTTIGKRKMENGKRRIEVTPEFCGY